MSHLANQENLPTLPSRPSCCSLARFAMPAMVLLTVASLATTAFFVGRGFRASQASQAADQIDWEALGIPINATASVVSEKYSMATGFASQDVEGLFVLDHNSGLLQCNVLYPRQNPTGGFLAQFSVNVADTLGVGAKGGEYIMVTGIAEFQRSSSRPAAGTVIYVMDTASGNYAGYGIPFDRVVMNSGRKQNGRMVLLVTGSANPIVDRDTLR